MNVYKKYRNKKVELDGMKFDSKKEARRYAELQLMQKAKVIHNLRTQVKFELVPSQRGADGKVIERPCNYVADFVYEDEKGNLVVEDTKGFKTKDYIIKRKLMLYIHGIKVVEI